MTLPLSPWPLSRPRSTVGSMSGASGTDSAGTDNPDVIADEARLAQRAAQGDGAAFATLYDRYEQRIFTFCQRITGSAEDAADATQEAFVAVLERLPKLTERDLNFAAYLFTTARHSAYRIIDKRKKAEPTDELPERGASSGGGFDFDPGDPDDDPERKQLAAGQQEEIRSAHSRLPERQREVLVLREVEEMSYDEIADVMEMNRNSVAQLISRARINLRGELRGEALASIAVTSPECEKALPLIAMRDDNQLDDPLDAAWLEQHLGTCDTCRASVEAMHEAGVSYRALAPAVPFLWLRHETIAKAAERMGFDWSNVPSRSDGGSSGNGGAGGSGGGGGGAGPAAGAGAGAGAAAGTPTEALASAGGAGGTFARLKIAIHDRRRRIGLIGGVAALLLLGGVVAVAVGGDDSPAPTTTAPAANTGAGPRESVASAPGLDGAGGNIGGNKEHKNDSGGVVPIVGTTTTTTTTKNGKTVTTVTKTIGKKKVTKTVKPTTRKPTARKPKKPKAPVATPTPTPDPTPTTHNDPPPTTTSAPPPTTTAAPPTTTSAPPTTTSAPPTTTSAPPCTGRRCPPPDGGGGVIP